MYQQLSVLDIQKNKTLFEVWKFVSSVHGGQTRKGINQTGILPKYTAHLFRVMEITANALGDPVVVLKNNDLAPLLSAALLHDTIEDTVVNTPEKLVCALTPIVGFDCSKKIAGVVQELSNPAEGFVGKTKEEKDKNKKEWQIQHALKMSIPAKLIKMADQIANIIDSADLDMAGLKNNPKAWNEEKKIFYVDKALAVCKACSGGAKKSTLSQKNMFLRLDDFASFAAEYALFKIKNPQYAHLDFFEELKLKNRRCFKKQNLIISNFEGMERV